MKGVFHKSLLKNCYFEDTGRKQNVRERLRIHSGHHLRVLCTFNLCLVFWGFRKISLNIFMLFKYPVFSNDLG